jgi:hypothetical protein
VAFCFLPQLWTSDGESQFANAAQGGRSFLKTALVRPRIAVQPRKVHQSITAKGSFIQRVQHSDALQAVLAEHIRSANDMALS